ncbi:TetR family transcriptional regulator [Variovorax paradoxus]|nr:TetR/AcrR family transcriptional regulator [Variovorax paradoxus]MBT2305086.1 TetR family transcriptional regulator [Variovorax paradoxus]
MAAANTVESILDAAEQVFGTHGFGGTSMRMISEQAGVTQSLLHYHFANKEGLYTAVFARRSALSSEYRKAKLAQLFNGDKPPTLEKVLEILVTPLLQFFQKKGNSAFYLQMVAEVTLATDERSKRIVSQFHDPSAVEFIAALRRLLPGISQEHAVWAYLYAVGARRQSHAQNGRAARLGSTRRESPYALLVPFLAGGIRALAHGSEVPTPQSKREKAALA